MKTYYPEVEKVCDVMHKIPHPKSQALAQSIRTCNTIDSTHKEKAAALLVAVLQFL